MADRQQTGKAGNPDHETVLTMKQSDHKTGITASWLIDADAASVEVRHLSHLLSFCQKTLLKVDST